MRMLLIILLSSASVGALAMDNPNALFGAISKGQADRIKELVANGHSLEDKDDELRTPLQFAVWVHPENMEVIAALLESGADVNYRGQTDYPLHLVASEDLARLLLDHGAQLVPDDFHNTPVHYAAGSGHTAVVRVLLINVTPTDILIVGDEVSKQDVVESIVASKLEAARNILAMRNIVGENVYARAASRGTISPARECELSRLIDGRHINGLKECIRQSVNKAWQQKKLKQ